MHTCPNCTNELSNIGAGAQFVQCAKCASILELADTVTLLTDRPVSTPIQWAAHCVLPDGTRFVSDGQILLAASYTGTAEPLPGKALPVETFQRLLNWNVKSNFGIEHLLEDPARGNYYAPFDVLLNGKYIKYLTSLRYKQKLSFHVNAPLEPIVLVDGGKKIGVLMPMKPPK
ncbi:MAG TPA: hypothetical protein PLD33_08895 [Anaerolineales bacterium]|nr:hypothetical protein [Anaerolineales bacterium]HMZ44518.1 hypothetical protein [Anaerolineales bacterium]HNA53008.1 hypothetical protein [Anaerolineales bacterium]HNC88101.1 hypothetical protein [Anaerolineales bacterium]HNH05184.1 hypothetical protein [Anaerolineales bacterium]